RLEGGGNNIIINNIISSSSGTGIEIFASDGNRIYNNFFNNTQNAKASHWQEGWKTRNYWNTTKTQGKRVYGPGKYIGGNYWTTPGGPGHSDSCTDDGDCFCKEPYSVVGDENKDNLPLIPCWRICPQKSCYTENGNQYKVSNVDPNGPYSCNEYEGCRYSEIQKCEGASDTDGGENYTTNGTCIRIKSCEDGECKQETFNDKCKSGAPSEVDLDPNGKIDIKDIAIVARAFGSKPGDTNWDPDADLDNNSIVNIIDIAKVAKEFGNSVGGGYLIEYYAFRDDCYNKLIDCSDVIGPGWHCEDGACVPCKSNLDCPTDSAIFTGCSKNRCVREGYYWHWECNTTTGFCDPKEIPYSVDVSEGKVCISNGLEVNATYAYNCKGDYTRVPKCSENSCSGYWYYAECDGYGNCDEDAKKFFEKSEQINASRGEVFDINCNSVLGNCSYERGCKGTCTAGNQWKACDGSGKCNVLLDIWEDLITCSPYLCQDGRCTDICERDCYGYMGSEDCDGKKVGDPCPGENRKECKDDCDGPKFCDYPLDFTYCPRKCTSNCVCDCTPPDCPPPTCVCSPACRGYECSSGTQQCTEKDCCIGTQTCIDCKWGSCDPPYAAGPCVAPEETCDIRDCTCRGGP
ncbi:MAG: NosD domain-containing protein, partial [Candidatus Aenigmarchaeota archaeon]|nr:NosD domain-containing protein [Candidatus Aenigmarchaeota archaeon]